MQMLDGIFLKKNRRLYLVYNKAVYFVILDTY